MVNKKIKCQLDKMFEQHSVKNTNNIFKVYYKILSASLR